MRPPLGRWREPAGAPRAGLRLALAGEGSFPELHAHASFTAREPSPGLRSSFSSLSLCRTYEMTSRKLPPPGQPFCWKGKWPSRPCLQHDMRLGRTQGRPRPPVQGLCNTVGHFSGGKRECSFGKRDKSSMDHNPIMVTKGHCGGPGGRDLIHGGWFNVCLRF